MPICPLCGQELADGALQCQACVAKAKRRTGMGEALDRMRAAREAASDRASDPDPPTVAGRKAAKPRVDRDAPTVAEPGAGKAKVDRNAPTVKKPKVAPVAPWPEPPETAPRRAGRWIAVSVVLLALAGGGIGWVLRSRAGAGAPSAPGRSAAVPVARPRPASPPRRARRAAAVVSRCPEKRELSTAGVSFCYPAGFQPGLPQWSTGAYGAETRTLTGKVVMLAVLRYLELTDPKVARGFVEQGVRQTVGQAGVLKTAESLKSGARTLSGVQLRTWSGGRRRSYRIFSFLHRKRVVVIQLIDQLDARGRPSAEAKALLGMIRKTLKIRRCGPPGVP